MNTTGEVGGESAALPSRRWILSAPESIVLATGPEASNEVALELAILELLVRGQLRLAFARRRLLGIFPRRVTVLRPGPAHFSSDSDSIRTITYLCMASGSLGGEGYPLRDLVRAIYKRYPTRSRSVVVNGVQLAVPRGGYVGGVVLPELYGRGLFAPERATRLGLFETTRWELTPSGREALAELIQILSVGRTHFQTWAQSDRERADAFAERAGAAMLLLSYPPYAPREKAAPTPPVGAEGDQDRPRPMFAPAFGVAALAAHVGPGPTDGLTDAFESIHVTIESIADQLAGGGGDGGGGE